MVSDWVAADPSASLGEGDEGASLPANRSNLPIKRSARVVLARRLLPTLRGMKVDKNMNEGQSSRPSRVGQAVTVLYVTLGIGVLRSIMEAQRFPQGLSVGFVMFVMFVTFAVLGLLCLFVYMIAKGRNWARITFLVLFTIGIPFSVLPLLQSLAANPVSGLLGVAQVVLQFVALTFLFQKPSSDWFKEKRSPPRSA